MNETLIKIIGWLVAILTAFVILAALFSHH